MLAGNVDLATTQVIHQSNVRVSDLRSVQISRYIYSRQTSLDTGARQRDGQQQARGRHVDRQQLGHIPEWPVILRDVADVLTVIL